MKAELYPGSGPARAQRIARYKRERIEAHLRAGLVQAEAVRRAAGDVELRTAAENVRNPGLARGLCTSVVVVGTC